MTVRRSIRRVLLLTVLGVLVLPATLRAADGPPDDEIAEPETVQVLPPVAAADRRAAGTDPTMVPSMMPLKRSVQSLKALRTALERGDVPAQTEAAHKVAVLAVQNENVPLLAPMRPALTALLFNHDAPDRTRLMALSALYKIGPEKTLHTLHQRHDEEPSPRVRRVMERMLADAWEPRTGFITPPA